MKLNKKELEFLSGMLYNYIEFLVDDFESPIEESEEFEHIMELYEKINKMKGNNYGKIIKYNRD